MLNRYKFTIVVSLLILYLSLKNANAFNKVPLFNIPNFDKVAHFLMYFGLMSVFILEASRTFKLNRHLLLLALFPFLYGILMEILQGLLTTTRNPSIYDIAFNTAGIIFSAAIWSVIRNLLADKFK
jgi:VanZ family protein